MSKLVQFNSPNQGLLLHVDVAGKTEKIQFRGGQVFVSPETADVLRKHSAYGRHKSFHDGFAAPAKSKEPDVRTPGQTTDNTMDQGTRELSPAEVYAAQKYPALLETAKGKGIDVPPNTKKPDLIRMLLEHDTPKA